MKKLFAAALLAVITLLPLNANAQRTEITASYGAYTQMDASDMKDGWDHVNTAWGALNLGVNFQVTRNIWIGPSYTFSSTTTKGGPDHSKIAYHAIMMNGRYHYYHNSIVTLYGKFGIGVEISHMQPRGHDSYNKSYCAFQIVPVGAQVDLSRQWAMFAEAGYGAQGIFQFGFKLRL